MKATLAEKVTWLADIEMDFSVSVLDGRCDFNGIAA